MDLSTITRWNTALALTVDAQGSAEFFPALIAALREMQLRQERKIGRAHV